MIKKICLLAVMIFALNNVDAQDFFKYGVRFGGATTAVNADYQDVFNGTDSLKMTLGSSNFGIHVGGFARLTLGPVFLQPEVLFNTKGNEYTVYNLQGDVLQVLDDRFTSLDVPIIVGYKFSALRFQAGAIGSMTLTNKNDLVDYFNEQKDVVSTLQGFNWGWQAGLGLDISKFMIDLKYEGNFQKIGTDIMIDGNTYNFNGRSNRFIVTFGYRFN